MVFALLYLFCIINQFYFSFLMTYFNFRLMSMISDLRNLLFLNIIVDFASIRLKMSNRRSSLFRSATHAFTSSKISLISRFAVSNLPRSTSSLPIFLIWASIKMGYLVRRCDTDNVNPFKPFRFSNGFDSLYLYHSEKRWSPVW